MNSNRQQHIRLGFLAILSILVLTVCATDEKQPGPLERAEYKGWGFFDYQNVRIFHPPGHPIYSEFGSIAAGYLSALKGITDLLGKPMPTDTLVIVFYSGYESGKAITGREYPFVSKGIIHFWYPSYYGTTLMQWYLPRWVDQETHHLFLKHGLISLFDHSGQNYHAATLKFVTDDRFIKLGTLATDQTINSDTERYQSAEAASFCAFIIAWYGPDVLETMYRSTGSFDEFVAGSLNISVDSLESLWLEVIRANQLEETQTIDENK